MGELTNQKFNDLTEIEKKIIALHRKGFKCQMKHYGIGLSFEEVEAVMDSLEEEYADVRYNGARWLETKWTGTDQELHIIMFIQEEDENETEAR